MASRIKGITIEIGGDTTKLPTSYDCELSAVEADTTGETEVGATDGEKTSSYCLEWVNAV